MSDQTGASTGPAIPAVQDSVRVEFDRDLSELHILGSSTALSGLAARIESAAAEMNAGGGAEPVNLSDLLDPQGDVIVLKILQPGQRVLAYEAHNRQPKGNYWVAAGCFTILAVTMFFSIFGAVAIFREVREMLR